MSKVSAKNKVAMADLDDNARRRRDTQQSAREASRGFSAKRNASMQGESIGERVKAKNEALRAIGATPAETADPVVDEAMDDLVKMLASTSMGGSRKGGAKILDAIGGLFSGLKGTAGAGAGALDTAAATVVNNLGTLGAVSGTVAVLNHPTVVGNLAQLFAEVLKQGTNTSITSTYGEWGRALLQLKDAAATVASTVVEQSAQGPVVPVAIAVLITMLRGKNSGRSFAQVLKDVASALTSVASRAVTGQIQAATDAYGKEAAAKGIRQLKEIAGRIDRPTGPGAAAMSAAVSSGAPAIGSMGVVPASPATVAMIPDAAMRVANATGPPGETSQAARALMDLSEGSGRRRRGKSRKPRKTRKTRRMTRRSKTITALKFVY